MKVYVILTDEEMSEFSSVMHEKFPWLCRGNTKYNAELVSRWLVSFDANDKPTKDAIEYVTNQPVSL